jgi:hypothetical protein
MITAYIGTLSGNSVTVVHLAIRLGWNRLESRPRLRGLNSLENSLPKIDYEFRAP